MFLDLDLFGLADHLLHLSLTHLLVLDAFEFALLDLVDDDERALLLRLLALDLALLLQLERLESFDLHHEVEALLLFNPLLLETLGLIKLAVADRHHLRVKHHLVHVLHVVVVLVHHLLGLRQQTLRLFLIYQLLLSRRHLVRTLLVQLNHALLSGLGSSHGRILLFFEESSLLNLLLFRLNLGGGLHAIELILIDDYGLAFLAFLGLLSDISQLLLGQGHSTSACGFLGVAYRKNCGS